MKMALFLALLFIGSCHGIVWGPAGGDKCTTALKNTFYEDRASIVDETALRLNSTWLSQECEARAGPEYLIRKYTFYPNGTFSLLRYHYADESCTIPTHTVTAHGEIKLLSTVTKVLGATGTKYLLHTVHIVPLNQQIAHKFEHRLNVSCSPQAKWLPFTHQLIYEAHTRFSNLHWNDGSRFNRLKGHLPKYNHRGVDCLQSLGIDFGELELVRVQQKPPSANVFNVFGLGSNAQPEIELFLAGLPANKNSRMSHFPSSLQSTALLRSDTASKCPICSLVSRATESSPPLLLEDVSLPAFLGGSWLSIRCESITHGLWARRQLQMYSGDKLWNGRWDYYQDARCSSHMYSITAAGSYVQRAGRQRRHEETERYVEENLFLNELKRGYTDDKVSLLNTDVKSYRDFSRMKREAPSAAQKMTVAEWMSPQLARHIFDIYVSKKMRHEEMLPTPEEINEALGASLSGDTETSIPDEDVDGNVLTSPVTTRRKRNTLEKDSYRHLLENAQPSMAESYTAMLRGNQRHVETIKKPLKPTVPAGTTELDLHVAESFLIPGDSFVASRCGGHLLGVDGYREGDALVSWPRSCVPHSLEAPSTLGLRARLGVNWMGQYTLKLGGRDDDIWEAPLHQCGPTDLHNPTLRAQLRRSLGIKFGLYSSSASLTQSYWLISCQFFFFLFYRFTNY